MGDTPAADSSEAGAASELHTFLVADVAEYTRFTEEHGDEAAARLTTHFTDLAERVVTRWRGRVVELRGDEVLAVFGSARDALHAALELQGKVVQQPSGAQPLAVRIGVEAGDAVPVMGGYRGGALNRAARLQSIAAPGDVLTSEVVVGLAGRTPGLAYRSRGEVQLKGLAQPMKVVQVVAADRVPHEVTPLSVESRPSTNISPQATRFVGREREIQEIAELVGGTGIRLLTLTGPGGIGKTRLAIQVMEGIKGTMGDGAYFVSLASIRDVDSVFRAIAQALALPDIEGQSSMVRIGNFLRNKQLLLVLDNLEQVLGAAPQIAELLSQCPGLRVLATSREILRIYGEQDYPVPPMEVPEAGSTRADNVRHWESVRLFLDRVSMIQPGFKLTDENAWAVAEICRRLDGLPLAIELAAARIRIFPPRVLLSRLDDRLRLLTGGPRNLPTRQQTLRNAIGWSYDLLDKSEQVLFERMSVFVGGCTLEAAEAVCNAGGDLEIDALDGLASLCDKSLLQQHEAPGPMGYPESRFSMLDTIRQFAAERIEPSGTLDDLRRHHAEYFLSLANRSHEKLMSAERDPWREMWNLEWGNLRAMLSWAVDARHPEIALPMAGLLWVWCWLDGPVEMRDWVERLLAMPEAQEPTAARGWGLGGAASMAYLTGDLGKVPVLGRMAATIARDVGDKWLLAGALILSLPANESALPMLEEARNIYRELGNVFGHGFVAVGAVRPLLPSGQHDVLRDWLDDAVADFHSTGDVFGLGLVLRARGILAVVSGELIQARAYMVQALGRFRSMHEKRYLPLVLLTLGGISRQLGEYERAAEEFCQALTFVHHYAIRSNVVSCLEGLAGVALDQGQAERAARLLGAAKRWRESSSSVPFPLGDVLNPPLEQAVRSRLTPESFTRITSQGYDMTEDEVVAMALALPSVGASRAQE